ncbi:MAG: hypothetical protein AB1752_00140 [Candidatus Zixiibacteriota bacterium]
MAAILFWFVPVGAAEFERYPFAATKGDSLPEIITHEQFLRMTVLLAVDSLLGEFTFSRPKPIWIGPADGADTNRWIHDAVTATLFEKGYVIYDAPRGDSMQRHWEFRYRLDRLDLALPEVARHGFLKRIWVKRISDATVHADLWDRETGELMWADTAETRVTDWVPKRDLPHLAGGSDPVVPPPPPLTMSERLAEPVVITAAVGALTILFFAVR